MAKRRKEKDEEEDKPFKIPKFDKEAFLKRERRNIKTLFIAFGFGVIIAIICFGFFVLMGPDIDYRWYLVLLVAIASISFIKFLFMRFNLDTSDFTKKNWFTTYATYIITWGILLMILINPPFYDTESPSVLIEALPQMQEPGGDILIAAKVTDNVGIDENSYLLEITDPDGEKLTLDPDTIETEFPVVKFIFENENKTTGNFKYQFSVNDINGYTTTKTGSFSYDDDAIYVDEKEQSLQGIDSEERIDIEVSTDISKNNFRVFYKLNDGEDINVNREVYNIAKNYQTTPSYEGWEENTNYSMQVYVEVIHYFPNILLKLNNIIKDTEIFNISTTTDGDIGEEDVPMPWNYSKNSDEQAPELLNYDRPDKEKYSVLPHPYFVQVPGFELLVLIIAMIVVAVIFKKKKKDERK